MTEPSKVIHVRNVGHEISEDDLLQLFQPLGVITKLVMLRAKNQALVQMQDIPSAVNVLQFYTNVQPSIRGRNVYIQFSSHQELTSVDQNSHSRGHEVSKPLSSINRTRVQLLQEICFRRNIYDGCCQLDIQFSNLDELRVNYNNERTRDFTNPYLPAEPKGRFSQAGYVDAGSLYALQAAGTPAVAFSQVIL
ncbi:hypothetical protein Nepgr_023405 [Nepenthes gracilis]|uniref:RRM domain-containing protein n=1 Tax=Nepenthes gracilis TaxID=150966 RepID=A0AAD3T202_NEPGR|nr:hypothetical protein Nepgr_023405 [Nepenthes gracilis]